MGVRVLGLESGRTSAEDHRHGLTTFMSPNGRLSGRTGIVPTPGAADLVRVSAMQAAITPFYAWIDGTAATVQGGYAVCLDADEVLTFADGEPGIDRRDYVVAVVYHDAYDGSGSTLGTVEVWRSDPDGTPPLLPPSSLPLWTVIVPAGASAGTGGIDFAAARSDARRYTTAAGGIMPVRFDYERPSNGYPGLTVFNGDAGQVETFDGATWRRVGQLDGPRGIVGLTPNLAASAETDTTEIIAYTQRFTAAAGRCYRITLTVPRADKGAPETTAPFQAVGALRANLRWSPGSAVTITSDRLTFTQVPLFRDDSNWGTGFALVGFLNNPPEGLVTAGVGIQTTVAGLRARLLTDNLGQLAVEDIGRAR